MSASNGQPAASPSGPLPDQPSEENLRKRAKRRAREAAIGLAAAQHALAREYGYPNWAELIRFVRSKAPTEATAAWPPLHRAARLDQLDEVARLLTAGAHVNQSLPDGRTALHIAARHGSLAGVELLIRHGAREWITDNAGRLPRDHAAKNGGSEKPAIVNLLTRPCIHDPHFKAAVAAIHAGDLATLQQLLADHPNLSRDSAEEPDCYPPGYFSNPKLLWFVANNPTLVPNLPANIVELTHAIIDAGVEQADLNYTLGLVMTSDPAVRQNLQRPLMEALLRRGAIATHHDIIMTLGHSQTGPIRVLLEHGQPITAPMAAGLGRLDDLARLLPTASKEETHESLSMAVMNRQVDAARLCLEAGADVNRPVAVHSHATPVHIAAGQNDVPMLRLLIEAGSHLNERDTLWRGTPLGWAIHEKQKEAEAFLRSAGATND